MGIMDMFNKAKQNSSEENKAVKINLTKNSELNKKISLRKDMVISETKKQNISVSKARIVFVLDHSGSMRNMYKDGTVQNILERIFPMAMYFDDNAEMEFYWFDNIYKELEPVNYSNIDGCVSNIILSQKDHFGGTCYAPVMGEIINRYAIKNSADMPTFVIFITDGSNSDKKASKDMLIKASEYNLFWKFIGIGKEKFEFLEKLDTLDGRLIDNANFISINNLDEISDSQLYSYLLEEYNDWLDLCKKNNIKVM